ncbi:MAG TPA: DUF5107 domain-containing protein [Acidobacteriota bacterium]|nr:DUF5107 domain-containing protein [Acidobacteriota bacterium]
MTLLTRKAAIAIAACAMASLAAPATGREPSGQAGTTGGGPAVRTWTAQVEIPTYPLGADDVNPHFYELEGTIIYPYTAQDRFGSERVDRTYRAVFIENEYLRVMCLPEIGGRIQSVFDKVTGQEMFYRNHVIRPGHIALRGAWVSGGIEWNRGPQGHTVTSFSPVDVVAVQNPDGSAALLIGNIEQNFRTGWEVRLTLYPGTRALDEQIRLFNPTDSFHPYYFWNNTAFPNTPGTRFVIPMSLGTDHSGTEFFSWPMHSGRDLRWLRNYPEPTSVFGYEVGFDFFGAYDVDRDFGIVQVANHHELPGKKAWTWGQSDVGTVAQSVLTDADGPYIEVQSGPLPTQADFGLLAPGQEVSWQETWYPVNGLGQGFELATRDLAIERLNHPDGVELCIAATRSIPGAEIVVEPRGGRVERRQLDLSAARTESFVVQTDLAGVGLGEARLRIQIDDANGNTLLEYSSPLRVPQREIPAPHGMPEPTAESAYRAALELDKRGDEAAARQRYADALRFDPGHSLTLRALGGLEIEAGRFDAAIAQLSHALERDPDDGLTWYLLGVARLRQGDVDGALAAGYAAVRRTGTTALGYSLVGRCRARLGDYTGATQAFTAGLSAGGADWTRLFEHILLTTYAAGDLRSALALAQQSTQAGTTRLVPWVIQALGSDQSLRDFAHRAREWVGEPEFAFLELSLTLADLGLTRDAANLVEAALVATVPPAERRALPLYYLSYYLDQLGDDAQSARWLLEATSAATEYVFPSRTEEIAVFANALARNPDDARARLYLGNLLAGLGRIDEASKEWTAAVESAADLSTARRNLALYRLRIGGDAAGAAALLAEAISIRPQDQTLYRDLGRVRIEQGAPEAAVTALESVPQGDRRADVTLTLVRAYVDVERFDDAIALLTGTRFTQREGDSGSREIFYQAHIERGVQHLDAGRAEAALSDFDAALTYPRNLNVGRPHRPIEARGRYWRGMALLALGRNAEARAAWREGAAGAPSTAEQREHIRRCREQLESGT